VESIPGGAKAKWISLLASTSVQLFYGLYRSLPAISHLDQDNLLVNPRLGLAFALALSKLLGRVVVKSGIPMAEAIDLG
jgi:hypothetical protein